MKLKFLYGISLFLKSKVFWMNKTFMPAFY